MKSLSTEFLGKKIELSFVILPIGRQLLQATEPHRVVFISSARHLSAPEIRFIIRRIWNVDALKQGRCSERCGSEVGHMVEGSVREPRQGVFKRSTSKL